MYCCVIIIVIAPFCCLDVYVAAVRWMDKVVVSSTIRAGWSLVFITLYSVFEKKVGSRICYMCTVDPVDDD